MNRFGRALRQARRAVGLTQRSLAERVGVDHTTLSKWETSDDEDFTPRRAMVRALEQALDLDDGRLLNAAGYDTSGERTSLSYGGDGLTPEQEGEVLEFIRWVRERDGRR